MYFKSLGVLSEAFYVFSIVILRNEVSEFNSYITFAKMPALSKLKSFVTFPFRRTGSLVR